MIESLNQYMAHGTEGPPSGSGGSSFNQYLQFGTEVPPDRAPGRAPVQASSVASYDLWKSFGEYMGWKPDASAHKPDQIDPLEAALKLGAATVLVSRPLGTESIADVAQHQVLDVVEKFLRKAKIQANPEVPTLRRIGDEVRDVISGYHGLMPMGGGISLAPVQRAQIIHNEASQLTEGLYQGRVDDVRPPIQEEIMLAQILVEMSKYTSQEELKRHLKTQVFARAQDIASAKLDGKLGRAYVPTLAAYQRLAGRPPKTVFIPDWLTKNTVLTPSEVNLYKDTFWGLGSTELFVYRISEKEDAIKIPYSALIPLSGGGGIQVTPGSWMMTVNFPRYADVLRKQFGIVGRFFADALTSDVGGTLKFSLAGREGMDWTILTRNPQKVFDMIGSVAGTARDYRFVEQEMGKQALGLNELTKPLIRPRVVRDQMSDPSLLAAPVVWTKDGQRDLKAEAWLIDKEMVAPVREAGVRLYNALVRRYGSDTSKWPQGDLQRLSQIGHDVLEAQADARAIIEGRRGFLLNAPQAKPDKYAQVEEKAQKRREHFA